MKIAIISTRGIPNNYGGFEQFAEYISVGLVERGHSVTVYSPHFHAYQNPAYNGVTIKHVYSPEQWMGSALGSFFYDYSSLRDALKNDDFDIIYDCGYTSIIPAYIRFKIDTIQRPAIITNMDGLEYKRTKFNPLVRKFIFWEEKMAVKYSHYLVSDNKGISTYYSEKYGKNSTFLAYGAHIYSDYSEKYLEKYGLISGEYLLVVARMEPENNVETIIQGYIDSGVADKPLILVGKTNTPFAKKLIKRYGSKKGIRFVGGIYDFKELNSIRHYSAGYFHGHSVGGTNPSLLEAMASSCFIIAHDNPFNKSVLADNAVYFSNATDISSAIQASVYSNETLRKQFSSNNLEIIEKEYSWEKIINGHEAFFQSILENRITKECI